MARPQVQGARLENQARKAPDVPLRSYLSELPLPGQRRRARRQSLRAQARVLALVFPSWVTLGKAFNLCLSLLPRNRDHSTYLMAFGGRLNKKMYIKPSTHRQGPVLWPVSSSGIGTGELASRDGGLLWPMLGELNT